MYQPVLSPHAMVHVMGSYQANGQFVPLQNHAFFASSPTNIHQDLFQFSQNTNNHNKRVLQVLLRLWSIHKNKIHTIHYFLKVSSATYVTEQYYLNVCSERLC